MACAQEVFSSESRVRGELTYHDRSIQVKLSAKCPLFVSYRTAVKPEERQVIVRMLALSLLTGVRWIWVSLEVSSLIDPGGLHVTRTCAVPLIFLI